MSEDTTNVTPLFGVAGDANQLAPTYELQAAYLEGVAKQIRAGETSYARCLLVLQPVSGIIELHPFGGPTNNMEFVGMLEMAKTTFLLDFFSVVR